MSFSKLEGECICSNADDGRFWVLRSPDDNEEVWGICCQKKSCQTEFLITDFCRDEAEKKDPYRLSWNGVQLFKKNPFESQNNHGFQASLKRIRLKKIQQLKKGDQITWSRKYFIWHHGVVTKVNTNDFEIIHWSPVNGKLKIVKETLKQSALKRAFKIDHSDVYTHDKARDLAVSRAYSRLHVTENMNDNDNDNVNDDCSDHDNNDNNANDYYNENDNGSDDDYTNEKDDDSDHNNANDGDDRNVNENGKSGDKYHIIRGNCEHFATYCIRGKGVCFQNRWAAVVAAESAGARIGGSIVKASAIFAIEGLENATNASELWGALGVVVAEVIAFSYDFYQLCVLFSNGQISRKVFYHEFIKHLTGSICGITTGVLAGVLLCPIPILEVLLAPVLNWVGKVAGMQLGSEIGLAITDKCINRDEKAVSDINSLNPGDHFVKTRFCGISRTHGIFVALGVKEGFIVVILFKKKRVIRREIKFSGIRRIIYTEDEELAAPEDVISAAESLIADPAPRVRSRKRQVSSCKLKFSELVSGN